LSRAIADLNAHLRSKVAELRATERLLRETDSLNHRQLALLSHALKHPDFAYTIRSHQTSHGTVYQTARADLLGLMERGFLERRKRGRELVFLSPSDLHDRIRRARR
jgi:Fic family protein